MKVQLQTKFAHYSLQNAMNYVWQILWKWLNNFAKKYEYKNNVYKLFTISAMVKTILILNVSKFGVC